MRTDKIKPLFQATSKFELCELGKDKFNFFEGIQFQLLGVVRVPLFGDRYPV